MTLGFGEIARDVFKSAWAQPVVGGAQGILSIPPPLPFEPRPAVDLLPDPALLHHRRRRRHQPGLVARRPRLERDARGRVGGRGDRRQHHANYKLLAFCLGAAFGCLSGALFAAKIGVVFPQSFNILVSINALALIILGGMGNIAGVVVGALVLVGLPELLREFASTGSSSTASCWWR